MVSRRKFLTGGAVAAFTVPIGGSLLTGWNGRKWRLERREHSPITEGPTVALEPITGGLKQPLALENPIGNHLYIADKFGQIHLYADGELLDKPILDISDKVVMEHGEQGLLGLEFHPEFEDNRRFYVRYSSPLGEGTSEGYSHMFVLSEFRMTEDYRDVVPDSERPILELPEPGKMHNAGAVEFGPDGYLYVTVGDGGGDGHDGSGPFNRGPDSHAGDWYWVNVGGNGQDITDNLLGSVLRIDINDRGEEKPYTVPEKNPLTGEKGLDEHYAWGFRNPYSMSFDGERLFVADAGTRLYEEVNLVEKGGNYGWNVKEGSICHNNFPLLRAFSAIDVDVRTLPMCPNATPNGEELIDPIITYPHMPGGVIIGGHVYRNSTVPEITNKYVFGDFQGRLFAANESSTDDFWGIEELSVNESDQSQTSKRMDSAILSIEKGKNDELYVLTISRDGGEVQRIITP